jgi:YidC/Oxa1 family membrane protein insertase
MIWRYVLAAALSMLVLILWGAFQPERRPAERQPATPRAPAPVAAPVKPKPEAAPALARPARERKEIPFVAGDHIAATADSEGARLAAVRLPDYHDTVKAPDPYTLLASPRGVEGVFSLEVEGVSAIPPAESWEIREEPDPEGRPSVVFENETDGISIVKTVLAGRSSEVPGAALPNNGQGPKDGEADRHLKVRVEIANRGTEERAVTYTLYGPAGMDSESIDHPGTDVELAFGTWGGGDRVHGELLHPASFTGGRWERGERIAWVGATNFYFTSVFFPISPAGRRADFIEKAVAQAYPDREHAGRIAREKKGKPLEDLAENERVEIEAEAFKNVRAGFRSVKATLAPGASVRHEYGLYAGPRDPAALEPYAALDLTEVNRYGMFGFLVKFFIWLLGVLKTIAFGSWGLAIILLTLIVKVCLHPINRKSQAGMMRFQKKMQKIKPEMDALKERHAQDRMRLNKEIQKLWKEHGINPGQQMAGCLIILLQLPIWYGLYSTLQYAIGLRQASFLYIEDLTRPDALFSFGVAIPWIGDSFNLLPLLYVILTVVNQRLQPRPEDPQMLAQYRMMTFMLVFFGFIFYKFPAGFLLYIMTSSGLGIIESKIIKAELARDEDTRPPEAGATAATPGGQSSGGPQALYPARGKKQEPARPGQGQGHRKGKKRR